MPPHKSAMENGLMSSNRNPHHIISSSFSCAACRNPKRKKTSPISYSIATFELSYTNIILTSKMALFPSSNRPNGLIKIIFLLCLQLTAYQYHVKAFQQLLPNLPSTISKISTKSFATASNSQLQDLDKLLMEFQKKNPKVQILQCDADQVQTMNQALWGIMADLSTEDTAQKVCVVLDKIPQSAITTFTDDYNNILTEDRLIKQLPELQRMKVSILGDSPALVLETKKRTPKELEEKAYRDEFGEMMDEATCTAALKDFVDTMVVQLETCPYTKTPDLSATGLAKQGVSPGPVAYRYSGSSDACAAVATFWSCVTELLSTPEVEISTTLLSLPAIGFGLSKDDHDRFAAVVELISRNLCLYRGDGAVGLVHFHPKYTRNDIHPPNAPSFGHLPPQSWLKPMMRRNNNIEQADSFTDDDLNASNYQRRAPHTMINILRVSQLNAAVGAKSIVDLELDDGSFQKASGIPLYSRNAIRLAGQGCDKLQKELEAIWEKY